MHADDRGSLTLTLIDRRSGVPFAGARVSVPVGGEVVLLRADAGGSCRLRLPQGAYDVLVSADGNFTVTLRGVGVLAGSDQTLVRALLRNAAHSSGRPSAAIGGFVAGVTGKPVPGLAVTAEHVRRGTGAYTARTDAAGAYVIHGVPPGEYHVAAHGMRRELHDEQVDVYAPRRLYRHDIRFDRAG